MRISTASRISHCNFQHEIEHGISFNSLSMRSLGVECGEAGVSPEDRLYTLKVFRKAEWFHETIFGTSLVFTCLLQSSKYSEVCCI